MKTFNFQTVSVANIVNQIIIDAVMSNASDIHFDPQEKELKVRIRIDGDLQDYSLIENQYKSNLLTRIKLLAGMNITETRLPQDGAIKSVIGGKNLDLRVSTLPTNHGEKLVIRILDYYMSLEGVNGLGFSNDNLEKINKMIKNPNGIVLVTGATGSGKSTTVYAMLQELNNEERNIITVEDPIEMNLNGINQIQVNSEIGLDFATVLRSILRQDPNVILIGEIRDSETARIAIRASITGHLVLSTLHTNNSLTTIERLVDMDVERYLLSASLKGIVSQSLTKKLCPKCAKLRDTTEAEKKIFKKVLNKDVAQVYEPVGCPECHKGYKGRFAIQEVLIITDEIRQAINTNVSRSALRDLIYKDNVKTLLQDGLEKVVEGKTTVEEVLKTVDIDEDYNNLFNRGVSTNEKDSEDIPNLDEVEKKEELEKLEEKEDFDFNIDDFINKKEEPAPPKADIPSYMEKKNNIDDEIGEEPTPVKKEEPTQEIIKPIPSNKNLENTQDIYQAILNKNNKSKKDDGDYTDNLINLINKDLFE